jgi:glycosyltransferase involved in cell wall biosynthesis
MMQIQLSVVIITLNEEKNIARCLDAVVELTNDIVVVDSFSTDKTKQVCEQYSNVNFIQTEWKGYSSTKNYANKQAKHSYILSLDADEVISKELKKSLLKLTKLDGVYEFNRLTNYCGKWIKHCGWYPDKKIRIFPKDIVYWNGEDVHETLFIPKNLAINFLKGDLLHYSFYTEEQHLKQIDHFTDISSKAAFDKGKRSNGFTIFYKSTFKFFRDYILKWGFLDGYYGYIVCKNSAYAKRLKYTKLKKLNQNK